MHLLAKYIYHKRIFVAWVVSDNLSVISLYCIKFKRQA